MSADTHTPDAPQPDAPAPHPPRRCARWPNLLILLAVILIGWGVWQARSGETARAVDPAEVLVPGSAKGFNLLFVTLDTTRVDRLGCYGYAQAHTPTIDSLAAHGVRFDDAVTSVPLTLPSHSVMMTGKYPPALGVRDNGQHLPDHTVTLAEILSTNGYATAAFVGAFVLDGRWGISQGFETFDFRSNLSTRIAADSLTAERPADAVAKSALDWLKQRQASGDARPFFMWVHFFDPHYPYESPLVSLPGLENRPYDAEIAMADAQLKRLLERLRETNELDKTLIVFVTDHGEGFYEKDEAYHGIFLYESTLHTALILSNPQLFRGPCRVTDRVVGTVDLTPTILELLAVQSNVAFDGRSLRAPLDADRAIYIETEFPLANGCAALYGLRRHTDKYINAPRAEYYDLRADPQENDNLYSPSVAVIAKLHAQLATMLQSWSSQGGGEIVEQTPEDLQELQNLGYIGKRAEHGDALPDPKDHIHVINKITEVLHLRAAGQLDAALALAEEVAAESEGWSAPIHFQAQIYEQLGRLSDSARVLLEQARRFPSDKSWYDYAIALYKLKDYEECIAIIDREVLPRDPKLGAAHLLRGESLLGLQRPAEALTACEEALRNDAERLGSRVTDCIRKAREQTSK